jgi:hypothetical protein
MISSPNPNAITQRRETELGGEGRDTKAAKATKEAIKESGAKGGKDISSSSSRAQSKGKMAPLIMVSPPELCSPGATTEPSPPKGGSEIFITTHLSESPPPASAKLRVPAKVTFKPAVSSRAMPTAAPSSRDKRSERVVPYRVRTYLIQTPQDTRHIEELELTQYSQKTLSDKEIQEYMLSNKLKVIIRKATNLALLLGRGIKARCVNHARRSRSWTSSNDSPPSARSPST